MLNVPPRTNRTKMPNMNPMSPTRVVMNAFIAAEEFSFSSQ
jgi:hypothetical protein